MSTPDGGGLPRFCREAQSQLAALRAGELTGWPAHTVEAHVRHCGRCSAELARQDHVAAGLDSLRHASAVSPPPGLLDDLLDRAAAATPRERAAVPVRGAVSGARPGLSVAFLTVGAAASTGLGYGVWRVVKAARALRRH